MSVKKGRRSKALTQRELVDKSVNETSSFRKTEQLCKFRRVQEEIAVPGVLLSFCTLNNFGWNASELTKRGHHRPHALVDHLAQIKSLVSQRSPASLETYLEHSSENTSS